jgi:hypothetical protein
MRAPGASARGGRLAEGLLRSPFMTAGISRGRVSIGAVLLLAWAGSAHADDAVPDPDSPRTELAPAAVETHWYGGRVLLADAASLAVLAGGAALDAPPVIALGVAGWFLASPVLHAQHATVGRGLGAFALRLGLPLAGFLVAKTLTNGCWRDPNASDTCDLGAEMGATLLGAISAGVIDVAWLARDSHAVAPARRRTTQSANVVVLPQAGGALMGLAGTF